MHNQMGVGFGQGRQGYVRGIIAGKRGATDGPGTGGAEIHLGKLPAPVAHPLQNIVTLCAGFA